MTKTSKHSKRSCLRVFLVLFLLLVVSIGVTWWWVNRPIEPVKLTDQEIQQVEEKVEAVKTSSYQPGAKEIVFTERELNGLLSQKTPYGDQLQFELEDDAIHARVESDLDEGMPIVGGRRLKAKARFIVKHEAGVPPELVLDDVTVWAVSLPNDWLGGLKGKNLLAQMLGESSLPGIESISVQPGRLVIRLKE
ncbi:hypothetical protein SAMN02745181_1860 [Rubritalea squalenifaciens DSM 18772]|uniref:DUF2140 family protein n=1 Tax=Rubritalea squalenifaciens DSM 18772 TaxID=1123071 RepID=A0A1M6IMM0_9BACT|nr:hypothetical protein [Rubritalea squalenifaciens]SHJ35589.1 hypothetical protein SAMN02745181_1860 [Rubritalea squalenifaciens DSM 18772]